MVTPILSKLGFSRNAPPPIHFTISLNAVPLDQQVAYGPASIIHGQVVVHISDQENTPAHRIRVVFSGEVTNRTVNRTARKEKDPSSIDKEILFEVESVLWGAPVPSASKEAPSTPPSSPLFVSPGRNLYLFAIKFPAVNLPPTINDPNNPIRVAYTLRAFLDRPNPSRVDQSNSVEVYYLPLIPLTRSSPPSVNLTKLGGTDDLVKDTGSRGKGKKKRTALSVVVPMPQTASGGAAYECLRSSSGEPLIEASAELAKPAYLPGDICSVKLTLTNRSDRRIATINLALASRVTSSPPLDLLTDPTSDPHDSKTFSHSHTYTAESVYCAIPRHSQDYTETLQLKLPVEIAPSTSFHPTRSGGTGFELAYDLRLVLVIGGTSMWPIPRTINADQLTLVLPLKIATVPSRFSLLPLQFRLPAHAPSADAPTNAGVEIPMLITNDEAVITDDSAATTDPTQPVFIQTRPVSPYIGASPLFSPSSPSTPWAGTPLPSPILGERFVLPTVSSASSSSSPSLSPPPSPSSPSADLKASVPIDASGHLMVPDPAVVRLHHRRSSSSASGSGSTVEGELLAEEPI